MVTPQVTDKIILNIGNHTFTTTRTTLCLQDGMLKKIANIQQENEIFIDRDGTHFRFILNYLRGSNILPDKTTDLKELCFESDFYCLMELNSLINDKLKLKTFTTSIETNLSNIVKELKLIR